MYPDVPRFFEFFDVGRSLSCAWFSTLQPNFESVDKAMWAKSSSKNSTKCVGHGKTCQSPKKRVFFIHEEGIVPRQDLNLDRQMDFEHALLKCTMRSFIILNLQRPQIPNQGFASQSSSHKAKPLSNVPKDQNLESDVSISTTCFPTFTRSRYGSTGRGGCQSRKMISCLEQTCTSQCQLHLFN